MKSKHETEHSCHRTAYKGEILMTPKSQKFKAGLSNLRARIANVKRHGTRRGFIDYYGCMSVCNELSAILDEAMADAQRGEYTYAYAVASIVLINCGRLAGSADDSAGGITDVRNDVRRVLEQVCTSVQPGSEAAAYIFTQALKDSQNKVFDGWDEFSYDLLLPAACLTTAENTDKLYTVLDALHTKLSAGEFGTWHLECDALVRLSAVRAVEGETAADAFVAAHLQYDEIRRIAIRSAMERVDYPVAEKLCHEKIDSTDLDYYWTREWYGMLFETYAQAGNLEKQTALAEELLVLQKDTSYYAILKRLLSEKNLWAEKYPALLEQLSKNLPAHLYLTILSEEGETQRLLEVLKAYPSQVFTYGKQVSAAFPDETYALCLDEIRSQAAEANCRPQYKNVCSSIKKLFAFGGTQEAVAVIEELKARYPRRPAMQDELNALAARLAKKKR